MASKVATIALLLFLLSTVSSTCPPPPPPPPPTPTAPAPAPSTCPDLKVCANLLGDMLKINVGSQQTRPCCSLIQGLADLEAAVCLCATIRANVLGVLNVNIKLLVQLLLNTCGKTLPAGFECP